MSSIPVPATEVRVELEKVLSSGTFKTSSRSSNLLRFLVEQTLAGNAANLKDYTLGAEALGRGVDFDPRTDPIARAEVSRLRSRLELYYSKEGLSDTLLITVPKGNYVPIFEARPFNSDRSSHALSGSRKKLLWGALVVLTLVASIEGVLLFNATMKPGVMLEARLEIATPPTTDPVSFALSPDGQYIVFAAANGRSSSLWIRRLDSSSLKPLIGTEFASFPFWSPDSRSIGFFADGKLKRIDIDGGSLQELARVSVAAGGAWNRDGVILFPIVPDSPIFKISVSGKGQEPTPVTKLEANQTAHRFPQFLPDERHFLFFVKSSADETGIYIGDIEGGPSRRLVRSDSPGIFAVSGDLLFINQGALYKLKLDPYRLEITNKPKLLAEGVIKDERSGISALSASAAGPIAFRTGKSGQKRQLVWFDLSGNELNRLDNPETYGPSYLSLSSDNRRLAIQRTKDGNTDIWLTDPSRGDPVRVTSQPEPEIAPVFSPAGDRLVFSFQQKGIFNLYQLRTSGGAVEEIFANGQSKQVTDWSPDGILLFRSWNPKTHWDVWALSYKDRVASLVVHGNFDELDGRLSPNAKSMAYQSDESGRFEIYIRPFPGPGEQQRVSSDGGTHPLWNGNNLFYISTDGFLISVRVEFTRGSDVVKIGAARKLFFAGVGSLRELSMPYAVSSDGKRFLIDTVSTEDVSPITVVLNWKSLVR